MESHSPLAPRNQAANRVNTEARTAEAAEAERNLAAAELQNPTSRISTEKIRKISEPQSQFTTSAAPVDEPRDLAEIQQKAAATNIWSGLKSLVKSSSKWLAIGCTGISALLYMTLGKWLAIPFFALTAAPSALISSVIPKSKAKLNTSKFSDIMGVLDKVVGDSNNLPKSDLVISEAKNIKDSCKSILANVKKYSLAQKNELFDKVYELYNLVDGFLTDGFTKGNEMILDIKKQIAPLMKVLDRSIVDDKVKAQSQA